MTETTVWAFKPLAALDNQTGFVVCDHTLADKLIESGDVQSLTVGGFYLKEIEADSAPAEYMHKDMVPEKRRGRPPKVREEGEE